MDGCCGYIKALSLASMLEKQGYKKILLLTGDLNSKMTGRSEIGTKILFGDGISLNILEKDRSIIDTQIFNSGDNNDMISCKIKDNILNIKEAEYLLCTGLFDEHDKELIYYKTLLQKVIGKIMICTNPDLIVDRGKKREFCAGSVAKVYEEMGGKVEYFGKPYPKVYNQSTNINNKKVLCIGDNLNTDIKGANKQKFDSFLIADGIHKQEIANENFVEIKKKYNVEVDYIQTKLQW